VSGEPYSYYIPLYIYSILRHYPDYYPLIYYQGKINNDIKKSLKTIQSLGKFEVKEEVLSKFSTDRATVKTLRWLLYEKEFEDFDYLYIGDIDIFIVRETPSLLEQHIRHSAVLNLPYSNMIREDGNKLTGLHFVEREPYYKSVLPLIKKYRQHKKFNRLDPTSKRSVNEHFLYCLIEQSGLGLPPRTKKECLMSPSDSDKINFRPHHGLHLRVFRKDHPEIKVDEMYQQYYLGLKRCESDPIYQQILSYTKGAARQQIQHIKQRFE
jgi:hypothetical protein